MEIRPVYFSTVKLTDNYLTTEDHYYAYERITKHFDEAWSERIFSIIAHAENYEVRTLKVNGEDIGAPIVEGSNLYFLQIC